MASETRGADIEMIECSTFLQPFPPEADEAEKTPLRERGDRYSCQDQDEGAFVRLWRGYDASRI